MKKYEWAVVGAGPAGIAAVGKLLDHGVAEKDILWIDPHFRVGDFGMLWRNVPSNTKVDLFDKFLKASDAFAYASCDKSFELHRMPADQTCRLGLMADPLQWVTDHLKEKVQTFTGIVSKMALKNRFWHLTSGTEELTAKNVVLAIGAEPKSLDYISPEEIALKDAIDPHYFSNHVDSHDTVAVFGSSHSAVLVLKNLVESNVKRIINFYRSPLLYAIYLKEGILFDDGGLKGEAATWARKNLDGDLPANLSRYCANEENIHKHLSECSKVVYAVGFDRRNAIQMEGMETLSYHASVGIIAPGLFGCGIAFPEVRVNQWGMQESRVGLWKFMDYLHRVMPIWLKYTT